MCNVCVRLEQPFTTQIFILFILFPVLTVIFAPRSLADCLHFDTSSKRDYILIVEMMFIVPVTFSWEYETPIDCEKLVFSREYIYPRVLNPPYNERVSIYIPIIYLKYKFKITMNNKCSKEER